MDSLSVEIPRSLAYLVALDLRPGRTLRRRIPLLTQGEARLSEKDHAVPPVATLCCVRSGNRLAGVRVGMEKIVYLIQAHSHPQLLTRLVSRLNHPQADFFIHIDAKFDIEPFRSALCNYPDVRFIDDRVRVAWGGFSQVESELILLRNANAAGPYRYYVLISGIDYPLKGAQAMVEFFMRNDHSFIDYFSAKASFGKRFQFLRRHQHYYLTDHDFFNFRNVDSKVGMLLHRAKLISAGFFFIGYFVCRKNIKMKYYNGSNWWNLTEDVVDYVLRFLDENPWYTVHYRNTYCPDEMFFQTAIMNSRLKDRVHPGGNNDALDFVLHPIKDHSTGVSMGRGALRYIDWTKGRGHPATLDENDFHEIRESGMLFARKVHPTVSVRLMDLIDAKLHGAP